jgi:hypothetical protein
MRSSRSRASSPSAAGLAHLDAVVAARISLGALADEWWVRERWRQAMHASALSGWQRQPETHRDPEQRIVGPGELPHPGDAIRSPAYPGRQPLSCPPSRT